MGQVAGDIGECEVHGTDEVDGWTAEHGIVLFTHEARVLDRFVDDVVHVLDRCEPREP